MRYENPEDVNMRLTHTIVRFKSEPVYVEGVVNGLNILVKRILWDGEDDKPEIQVDPNDSLLDISSPPLGNSNTETGCVYVTRATERHQKQGLDHNRVICWFDNLHKTGYPGSLKELGETIVGKYPMFSDSLYSIKYSRRQVFGSAFDRYLSVWKTQDKSVHKLKHLASDIGLFFPEDKSCFLIDKYRDERLRSKLRPFMEILN